MSQKNIFARMVALTTVFCLAAFFIHGGAGLTKDVRVNINSSLEHREEVLRSL